MGICYGKNLSSVQEEQNRLEQPSGGYRSSISNSNLETEYTQSSSANSNSNSNSRGVGGGSSLPPKSPWRALVPSSPSTWTSPFRSPFRASTASPFFSTSSSTVASPAVKRPFPPPSPAKHIQAALAKRFSRPKNDSIPEGQEIDKPLDKSFGYYKRFEARYELGDEIGRGHFGHTCRAKIKKGENKGLSVAVKVISKAKMTTAISIEDVKREVKILKALSGHPNLVKFYDACEDSANVYIVMELCEGGELLDRILSRGGKYSEEDAKVVTVQILSIVSFCHLQGVVHRDLKPENFLFSTRDEDSQLKAIDFGLSDFVRPDERLNDIVGSAYYVAPEVLHRSYSMEADVWSVGVITYILLCGSRPFWARTESGIFKSVLKTAPNFDEEPWPSISAEAKDFVKRLLNKDRHKRLTAAQALAHPWIRGQRDIPLDIMMYKLVKFYLRSTSLRRAALKALAKTLSEDDLFYLRAQFAHLKANRNGQISLENFKTALSNLGTDALKESRMFDMIAVMDARPFKMDFEEFCAAAMNIAQLEGPGNSWESQAQAAYQIFDQEDNRVVIVEDLAKELGIPPTVPTHVVLHDWIRHNDGKLSLAGFTYLIRGMPPRNGPKARNVK